MNLLATRYPRPATASCAKLSARRSLVALAVAGLFAAPVPSVLASTINVDGTNCTLLEAINNANNDNNGGGNGCSPGSGTDTLVLPTTGNFPSLTAALPRITSSLTIKGNRRTVQRSSASTTPAFAIFKITKPSARVKVQDLTISGGRAVPGASLPEDSGTGGIFNAGTLTLIRTTISNNAGSGIKNVGRLTVSNSTFSGNNRNGSGGAIFNEGTATLSNSTFTRNTASLTGGALINSNDPQTQRIGNMMVTNCTVSGNNAMETGGGITNSGVLKVLDTTLSNNTAAHRGGGISATAGFDARGGKVEVRRSLVSGNVARQGSEIFFTPSVNLLNDSFNVFGHNLRRTAEALSGLFPSASDRAATSDGSHPTALAVIRNALALNAPGKTQTHALPAGSPAIDASGNICSPKDQRGVDRPRGAGCDAGAFER